MTLEDWLLSRPHPPAARRELAIACGVNLATVYRWAADSSRMSPEAARAVEAATSREVRAAELRPDLAALFSAAPV